MTPLSELCVAIVDCEHKTAPKSGDGTGYALVRTSNIGRGRLDLTDVHRIDAAAYDEWTRRAVPKPGDLILAREAPVGNVAVIAAGMEPVLGQRTVLIRPDQEKVDADFLTYRLLAHDVQHWMSGVANGATVSHLNMEDIRTLPVPELPPLRAQVQIGAVLASFDDLIENNRRRIEILEETARLLYREWFVHFRFPGHEDVELVDSDFGLIPEGWEVSRVGDALETVGGGTPSKEAEEYWTDGNVQWFTPTDLTRTRSAFAFDSGLKINELGLKKSSARLFPAGSVMMTSRATIGVVSIAATEATTNQGFVTTVPNERLPSDYIYFWLQSNVDLFLSLAGGATFRELRKSTFRELPILVPGAREMEHFKDSVGPMMALIKDLLRQNGILLEARDLLLPRLVSGELDVSKLDLDLVAV